MPAVLTSPLVAVDANVLMDLGERVETVLDALITLRQRFRHPRLVIPPTAQQELVHIAGHGDTEKERLRASGGIGAARRWLIVPVNLMPVGHGIVERVGEKLRGPDLLPPEEVNDSLLLAEAALLEARLLLSSDEHLRGINFTRLNLELHNFDLTAPVIVTPAEVARKFFLR